MYSRRGARVGGDKVKRRRRKQARKAWWYFGLPLTAPHADLAAALREWGLL